MGENNKRKANGTQDAEKLKEIPPEQKVWVGGLSGSGITWKQLQGHFGQVGKPTYTVVFDEKKGTGCVCYKTAQEAIQAQMMNGTTIGNTSIQVDSWAKADPTPKVKSSKAKSSGKWQGGGKAQTSGSTPGVQHLVKQMILKAFAGGPDWKGKGKNKAKPNDKDKLKTIDDSLKVWVGGLTSEVTWEQLQNHFKQAGKITWSAAFGKQGYGCVAFKTAAEAQNAIVLMNGSVLGSCTLEVDFFKRTAK